MTPHRIYVDFQHVDDENNVLPTGSTRDDLTDAGIDLKEDLIIPVYDMDAVNGARDDLIGLVKTRWNAAAHRWTFEVLEDTVQHESEVRLGLEAAIGEAYDGGSTYTP